MRQQGSCTLPADESGRVLERLAGLSQVIPTELQRQVFSDTGRVNVRACRLTHEVMLWVVLAMGLFTDVPIRQVFKLSRRSREHERTPARSSLSEARQRLGVEPLRELHRRVVRPLATPQTPGALFHGLRPMALDGTILDAPDTPANREAFHRASGSRGEGGFPQVRKVSLVELSTHVEAAFAMGGWQNSESTLAASLLDRIPTDALLILDRGFFSFKLWKSLRKRNIAVLMRVKSQLVLQPIKRLKDGSFIARIYPNGYDRSQDRNGIEVRLIEYTISDPERPGYGEKHRLVTSLLDEREFPALEIVTFYHEQWEIELTFDEQKTHLDPIRASKPAQLRSETPLGVEQEVLALSLAHFVIRALMFEAAQRQKIDPDRLSFTGCLHVLRAQLPECPPGATETQLRHWYDNLLWHLGQERTEPRRNRSNPRVVKRKMSRFGQKRPKHRPRPKLTKTFAETIVIT